MFEYLYLSYILTPTGGFGYDFSSDLEKLEEGLSAVAKGILATGVTSFCPTIVTSPSSVYHEVSWPALRCEAREGKSRHTHQLTVSS